MGRRNRALQQNTSLLRSTIFPLNHVHDPAAQVPRRCLCCPQLLPLVHLARPRLRDDLRRGWREQALRLRLRHWTDFRVHGDQLKSQRQHQRPTSWTLEPNKDADRFFSHFDFFSEKAPITIGRKAAKSARNNKRYLDHLHRLAANSLLLNWGPEK